MTRILLRAPMSPFDVHSVETTIERNLIATNAGNLVFLDAAWKLLAVLRSRSRRTGWRCGPVTRT